MPHELKLGIAPTEHFVGNIMMIVHDKRSVGTHCVQAAQIVPTERIEFFDF